MGSHWQKVKLSHKEGKKKQEVEEYFGIKSMVEQTKKEIKKDPEMFEKLKETPTYKKEFKSEKLLTKSKKKSK